MNLNDFFIFMSRFALGNMVLQESLNPCSSAMAQNMVLNLSTIKTMMMKMISAGGVTAKDVSLDLRETLEDPQFLRFCRDMRRTYKMIHKEEDNEVLFPEEFLLKIMGFTDQKMQICSPKDLVEMIDRCNTCSSNPLA